jgi:hypothetical protein
MIATRHKQAADREGIPFPRPSTILNKLVLRCVAPRPVNDLSTDVVERCQRETLDTLRRMGAPDRVLNTMTSNSTWRLEKARAPDDAWGGEVLVGHDGGLSVVLYTDCALTRLRSRYVFDVATQLAVDHMIGHLFEFHRGGSDYGEEAASRWQFWFLLERGGIVNRVVAGVLVVTTLLHKHVPVRSYWPCPSTTPVERDQEGRPADVTHLGL